MVEAAVLDVEVEVRGMVKVLGRQDYVVGVVEEVISEMDIQLQLKEEAAAEEEEQNDGNQYSRLRQILHPHQFLPSQYYECSPSRKRK